MFVCSRCFGPLEPVYDLAAVAGRISPAQLEARPANLWRFAELLPLDTVPTDGLNVPVSPLVPAPRLARRLGLASVWVKVAPCAAVPKPINRNWSPAAAALPLKSVIASLLASPTRNSKVSSPPPPVSVSPPLRPLRILAT